MRDEARTAASAPATEISPVIGRGVRSSLVGLARSAFGYAVGTMSRPLLFLDVDGPLIPFGGRAREYPVSSDVESSNPLLARVDPALGQRLLALGCDLVATWLEAH